MPKHEKPLPKPPSTPFSRRKSVENREEQGQLLTDRMAAAIAEDKLEDFLKQELPDSEYARKLATMMMGMTGMLPAGGVRPPQKAEEPAPRPEEVPEDVARAVQGGDVMGLMDLLRREHQKRVPEAKAEAAEEAPSSPPAGQPVIDKDIIDALVRIASDNSVTLDWIILRAIKLYVEEYRKSGKL